MHEMGTALVAFSTIFFFFSKIAKKKNKKKQLHVMRDWERNVVGNKWNGKLKGS